MSVCEHLKKRHLNTSLHTVWVDEDQHLAVLPLWNLSGQMVGYQQYRPFASKVRKNEPKAGKYFTYRNKANVSVWGLESWNLSNTLFITEGVFDACRLTKKGYSAIALLSNDPNKATKKWLWLVRKMRKVVAVCDNDSAGLRLKKYGHLHHVMADERDLGDVSNEYVEYLLEEYS